MIRKETRKKARTNIDVLVDRRPDDKKREQGKAEPEQCHRVPVVRHNKRDSGVCVLSATLKSSFRLNELLKAVSPVQPDLRFYVRANAESFSDAVEAGKISILKEVADRLFPVAKDQLLPVNPELELLSVGEDEPVLEEVVFVLLDRYLSKRDLWHLHLTMMQECGALIYSCYEHNFSHHIADSRIESMSFAAKEFIHATITKDEWKDGSGRSREDAGWKPGREGRLASRAILDLLDDASVEKWREVDKAGSGPEAGEVEILDVASVEKEGPAYRAGLREKDVITHVDGLEATAQNVEKALKATSVAIRVKRLYEAGDSEQCVCGRVSPDTKVVFKSGSINMFILIQVSSELLTHGLAGLPYYEILLECFAHLVDNSIRVRGADTSDGHYIRIVLFARAREDFYEVAWEGYAGALPQTTDMVERIRWVCLQLSKSARGDTAASWGGVVAGDLVEASRGNLLECLNHCLDHLDLHYLDRSLRVTGQKLVVLTAGNGLVYATSRELYELTHRRFQSAGPSSEKALHIVCVREPPLHHAPWVMWPGGDANGSETLPAEPSWMDLSFYKEVVFCPVPPLVERPRSCLLPLESLKARRGEAPQPRLQVPQWDEASFDLREAAGERPRVEPRAEPAEPAEPWPGTRTKAPRFVDQDLIKELRAPELRSFFYKVEKIDDFGGTGGTNNHTVTPDRFKYTDADSEMINTIADLMGCRLEARTSEICFQGKMPGSGLLEARNKSSPDNTFFMQGQLIPEELKNCTVRAADGQIQWKMEADPTCGLTVTLLDKRVADSEGESDKKLVYRYESWVRGMWEARAAGHSREDGSLAEGGTRRDDSLGWTKINRAFHMPQRPDWNALDRIIAGNKEMEAALPYPVTPERADLVDKCPGWQLRSAIKQHLYVLVPREENEYSHRQVLEVALRHRGHRLGTGVDPFCVLEERARPPPGAPPPAEPWDKGSYPTQSVIDNFRKFTSGLDDLCFHKKDEPKSLGIKLVSDGANESFTVKRRQETIYIRDTSIGFPQSRDWFEIFYDSQYAPPKLFVFALQWMVCSSNHLVKICKELADLARKNGFVLVRTPIGQLFPQPAPHWVLSNKRETNFDRMAFHAPRKLKLPECEAREALNAKLLQCWLEEFNFVFMFSADKVDCRVELTTTARNSTDQMSVELFQRLEGWVLSRHDGLCIVTLRKQHIFWFENRLVAADARKLDDNKGNLEQLGDLWQNFWRKTWDILDAHSPGAEAPEAGRDR